jgi:hypothetical protein
MYHGTRVVSIFVGEKVSGDVEISRYFSWTYICHYKIRKQWL